MFNLTCIFEYAKSVEVCYIKHAGDYNKRVLNMPKILNSHEKWGHPFVIISHNHTVCCLVTISSRCTQAAEDPAPW